MPATDSLQPPLTPAERAIVKTYGGWTSFMSSYGLKPWDFDDIDEAKQILTTLAQMDDQDDESERSSIQASNK
ncbi:hypothetical protein ASPZODRAFT_126709 [Penicilliopsis zonata CBS 506.65]|uniref:Uncharacterized protein n=1 Tax=Penicilliopsis zonata CBS 506.65 TaxID=1073090 RepID=A0A1L9SU96_9EURO|nr:hypothetical protein ASPZODRAFT_126709 [Penicilliopsis zonata CBS 506.65]OJJ50772.1 hypothetical protein ASPZODRAFT_126709 [Penicilliopsis zonata CBS 506.65]